MLTPEIRAMRIKLKQDASTAVRRLMAAYGTRMLKEVIDKFDLEFNEEDQSLYDRVKTEATVEHKVRALIDSIEETDAEVLGSVHAPIGLGETVRNRCRCLTDAGYYISIVQCSNCDLVRVHDKPHDDVMDPNRNPLIKEYDEF